MLFLCVLFSYKVSLINNRSKETDIIAVIK
jgi:hypothetical protein